ncbi:MULTISPECIES: GNAT family N-acetyltransferase [Bacillus]|uniref:N-acetyltransferase n=1 Tax=Bacillus cereus TaxID=1396 RepID=A0A2C1LCZ3_BACCE|nr:MULTISPECIES: GNAT family N-acetyltransferase [Bacillus]MDH4424700.1 GNAT family N-acetyltransferase [Bacillus cereus]PGL82356.1 N-acetyltransferase [Bacillus sp. AFS054943]PGU02796.1 N-acetyltransferase [Bacillus cereus]PGX16217.1 N-acetyltransferase [Bacillus sp. AFS033286]PGZ68488.1 N-acetyltransferase [Bacillus sp. AFS029637]
MKICIKELNGGADNQECIKEIVELWNKNAIETAECELDESDRKAIQEQIEQFIQSKYGVVFVAINENQQTIGYGIASMKQDLVSDMLYGQVDEVYVAPEYRRKKVAKNLATDLMDWFNQKDISLIHVYVDLENELALEFWEKMGLDREFFILSNN